MRISDWSSDVCSSDLDGLAQSGLPDAGGARWLLGQRAGPDALVVARARGRGQHQRADRLPRGARNLGVGQGVEADASESIRTRAGPAGRAARVLLPPAPVDPGCVHYILRLLLFLHPPNRSP